MISRPKWVRVEQRVYDGPLFGWRLVAAHIICQCAGCVSLAAAGHLPLHATVLS